MAAGRHLVFGRPTQKPIVLIDPPITKTLPCNQPN